MNKYSMSWTTKNGDKVANQVFTADHVSGQLQALEEWGATDIRLEQIIEPTYPHYDWWGDSSGYYVEKWFSPTEFVSLDSAYECLTSYRISEGNEPYMPEDMLYSTGMTDGREHPEVLESLFEELRAVMVQKFGVIITRW